MSAVSLFTSSWGKTTPDSVISYTTSIPNVWKCLS